MSIKAIINNTEKEIEQIKNSDEQDIDYVYSRIGDTEVEGELPISIKSIGGNLADYRIYGNTVDGESVGDRTGNLWNGAVEQGSFQGTNGDLVDSPRRVRSTGIQLSGGNYTISATGCDNIILLVYSTAADYILSESTTSFQDLPFSFSLNDERIIRFAFKKNDNSNILPSNISNIMLNSGSTALPYEPYGYKVPVTVEGKNLINSSIYEVRNTGVEYTVNNDKSVTANGSTSSVFSLFLVKVYLTKGSYIISGCPQNGSQNTYRCEIRDMELTSLSKDTGAGVTYSNVTDGYYYYSIRIAQNYVCDNLTFYPMIRKADIEDDTYEPYHAPVTAPIYLTEQIRKVGDEAEYIDYGEQKMHRIGADDIDVTLPALPILTGTNVLSVGTAVQPSKVEIKGHIK